jgi:hypothetical protein
MNVKGGGSSETEIPFLRPVIEKELSSVQLRPLEEQMFRAMAALHDQKQRHGVARLVGMATPLTIVTPTIQETPANDKMAQSFLTRVYKKLPLAMPCAETDKKTKNRAKYWPLDY